MIRIIIETDKIIKAKESILKAVMLKRAYKGYCKYLECENTTPLPYNEFKTFEYWKIHLAFRQYFAWCRGDDFKSSHLNFKSLVLNTI